ncbi:MAG: DUF4298 domain-containing protein [Clostridia bacterium]|nr:DUF4298 domain-containing protein [Clostridia bacterium]
MKKTAQIERIERFEEIFDELTAVKNALNSAVENLYACGEKEKELERYYGGKLWKKDYAADESGKLPPELKRGVLSEDGVYDLLEELKELRKQIGEKAE